MHIVCKHLTLFELLYFTIFVNSNIKQFNINGADVYVAQFDKAVEVQPVLPPIRQQMIDGCQDATHKQQSYCVWLLLDYALKQKCGKGVDAFTFTVDGNGKWSSDNGVSFSLSHSENVVAVALSSKAVGVDVEAVNCKRFNARLADRILTENERSIYNNVTRATREAQPRLLAEFWTAKESVFKRDGGNAFVASGIDTTSQNVACQTVTFDGETYIVSVAS